MEQLTKNQAVATSQEAVQNQNEPQLRDENAHNDKSVHGVLNPTYQAGLRRDAVQPDIEAERKKRDEIEAGKSYCSRRFGGATCDDKSAQIYARDRKSGSAGMPRPNSYAAVCLTKTRAAANCFELPLYRYLGGADTNTLPTPMMNILNNGTPTDNNDALSLHDALPI